MNDYFENLVESVKEEIQRQRLSDLYFKHLDATWEQIEYMRQANSDRMKMYAGKCKFKNEIQYLNTYRQIYG